MKKETLSYTPPYIREPRERMQTIPGIGDIEESFLFEKDLDSGKESDTLKET